MARYVNADKLLEYLEKEAESDNVKYSFIGAGVQATISVIKTFPLEDVAPVIHAHWINGEECSECGGLALMDYDGKAHIIQSEYCPHCGAKMDEEPER